MEKFITISGEEVALKSSGALPRLYRTLCGRDIFKDMVALEKMNEESLMSDQAIGVLENIAYTMHRHAVPSDKRKIEEWLESFGMFGIIQALPDILAMWNEEIETQSTAKKKNEQ